MDRRSDLSGPEDAIFDAVLRLGQAFRAEGLQSPAVIELASWEEGMKILRLVRTRYRDRYRQALYGRRDEPVTEVQISGVTVRWPPRTWRRPGPVIDAE